MEILGAVGTLLAGLFFLVLAYGNVSYERHRRSHGVVTEGVVVGSDWQLNSLAARYQAPEVEFVDQQGTTRRFQQPSGTTFRPEAGSRVQVWYDPADPEGSPVLHQDRATRLFPVVFGLAGLVAVLVGAVLLVGALR